MLRIDGIRYRTAAGSGSSALRTTTVCELRSPKQWAPGQFDHPEFKAASQDVLDACQRHNKIPGFLAADIPNGQSLLDQGFRMLVGEIIGQPLDDKGSPIEKTLRQEDYMEARFDIAPGFHERLIAVAIPTPAGESLPVPQELARSLVSHAGTCSSVG